MKVFITVLTFCKINSTIDDDNERKSLINIEKQKDSKKYKKNNIISIIRAKIGFPTKKQKSYNGSNEMLVKDLDLDSDEN